MAPVAWREKSGPFDGPGGRLFRRAALPPGRAIAQLSIIHGYGDHSGRYVHFMQWLAARGIACEAVDLRGQGAAEGRRGYVRKWEEYLDDVRAFLALPASDELAGVPRFVLGHSHGGLVVAVAGETGLLESAGVRGVVLTSPFLRRKMRVPPIKLWLGRFVGLFVPWLPVPTGLHLEWMSSDPAMVEQNRNDPLCARVATPRWYAGQCRAQTRVMANASAFRLPLLVLAAGADPIADPAAAEEFQRATSSADKAFGLYPGFLHEPLRETARERVFRDVHDWIVARSSALTS